MIDRLYTDASMISMGELIHGNFERQEVPPNASLRELYEAQRDYREGGSLKEQISEVFARWRNALVEGEIEDRIKVLAEMDGFEKSLHNLTSLIEDKDRLGNAVREAKRRRYIKLLEAALAKLLGQPDEEEKYLNEVRDIERDLASVADVYPPADDYERITYE